MKPTGKRCYYCGIELVHGPLKAGEGAPPDFQTKDHVIPRCRGGLHKLGNKVFACYKCNQRKDKMTADEFFKYVKEHPILPPTTQSGGGRE